MLTRIRLEQVMAMYNVRQSEARRMYPTVTLEEDDTQNIDSGYDPDMEENPEATDHGD